MQYIHNTANILQFSCERIFFVYQCPLQKRKTGVNTLGVFERMLLFIFITLNRTEYLFSQNIIVDFFVISVLYDFKVELLLI